MSDNLPVEAETFVPGYEGARQLSRALRRPMPIGFEFNFINPCSCAMGLASFLWPKEFDSKLLADSLEEDKLLSKTLKMPLIVVDNIFWDGKLYSVNVEDIQSWMVADQIDIWLIKEGQQPGTEI
jgi:hypothetical protein